RPIWDNDAGMNENPELPVSADANRRKRFKSADEAWSVLRGYGDRPADRALELKQTIAAGTEPDPWLIQDVHGALLDALAQAKEDPDGAPTWMYVFDPKDSKATRSIIRG